jgi:HEAT repeat protein
MTFFQPGTADGVMRFLLAATALLMLAITAMVALAFALRVRYTREVARAHALTERWRPSILATIADPTDEHVEVHVAPGEELYFLDQVWAFARRVRGAEREALLRIARPHLWALIERTGHADEDVRARAIQALAVLGMPEHAGTILGALDDPSAHVSITAARGLARRDQAQYAPDVLARLDRFHLWSQRYLSAMLAGMGPSAARYLRWILADESKSEWSRTVCASALTIQHPPS